MKWFALLGLLLFFNVALTPGIHAINNDQQLQSLPEGNILYVGGSGPGNYTRIQDAIDTASNGDMVYVYQGTYYENIIMKSGVAIKGQGADKTTIDGMKIEKVVTAMNVDSTASLEGFTITNGSAQQPVAWGGGMMNHYSSPMVINCTFTNNEAVTGGGIYISISGPTLINCSFVNNKATFYGGGMYINGWVEPKVINCLFINNRAYYSGGGYYNDDCETTVTNCLFYNNVASTRDGGGMYITGSSKPIVTNCIIWDNTPDEIYGQPQVTYSDVNGSFPGVGNIDLEPLFKDTTTADFHLQQSSPCIDAGNNFAPSLPNIDFEGDPRIMDGNNDGVEIVDMGIDERRFLPVHNIDKDTYYAVIQAGIDDADTGNTLTVANGTYFESIVIDETINLIGENKETTSIDYSWMNETSNSIVTITADSVKLRGFTITGGDSIGDTDVGILLQSSNNTIIDNIIDLQNDRHIGIKIAYSNDNTVTSNTIRDDGTGILIEYSDHNTISNNTLSNFIDQGIHCYHGNFNIISANTLTNCGCGMAFEFCQNNIIYHNNLFSNTQHANDNDNNKWDNDYPSCGNYWDDYTGTDANGDGIGDTPHNIPGGENQDRYPLMEPYGMTTLSLEDFTGGLFKCSGVIKNNGDNIALNVQWNFIIEGGIVLLGTELSGTVPKPLLPGEESPISSHFIFGFGSIIVTFAVWADNAPYVTVSTPGKLFLFFIKI
ncbi:MAG: right-handed parallel beta-helix repeat-containing protein [Candidatus Thermoplasmatota archaeon]|nr:right-handed parallel beta-helix repeat-containing protein [Candidatus Thermoplasmatota archaeon]